MPPPLRSLAVFVLALASFTAARAADDQAVVELRIYTTEPGRLDALLARFRDHTRRLFEKHGMVNLGYWVPLDSGSGAGTTLYYMLGYPSRAAAEASWAAFRADPDWQAVRQTSEVDGKILARPPESIFLAATDYSAALSPAAAGSAPRVFELRTYRTPEGKLPSLHARFRDHTRRLFETHGMTNVGYWVPLDEQQGAGHTLIYLLAHGSRDAATAAWKAFRADPAWIAAKSASERDGALTLPNGVSSVFLAPTDFSPLR